MHIFYCEHNVKSFPMRRAEMGGSDGDTGSSCRKLLASKEKEAGAVLSEDQPFLVYMAHVRLCDASSWGDSRS